jgi:hypothetical protein
LCFYPSPVVSKGPLSVRFRRVGIEKKASGGIFFQRSESSAVATTKLCGLSNRKLWLNKIEIQNKLYSVRKSVTILFAAESNQRRRLPLIPNYIFFFSFLS